MSASEISFSLCLISVTQDQATPDLTGKWLQVAAVFLKAASPSLSFTGTAGEALVQAQHKPGSLDTRVIIRWPV